MADMGPKEGVPEMARRMMPVLWKMVGAYKVGYLLGTKWPGEGVLAELVFVLFVLESSLLGDVTCLSPVSLKNSWRSIQSLFFGYL